MARNDVSGSRRRSLAIVLTIAIILGAGALVLIVRDPEHSTTPTTAFPASAASLTSVQPVRKVGLISPGVGWAMNSSGLYVTTDDSGHWRRITPPGIADAVRNIAALDFLDANHAWVAVVRQRHVSMTWHTVDGGRSWQPASDSSCASAPNPVEHRCSLPASIDFIDAKHGWWLAPARPSNGTLLATSDGGATWTFAARTPFPGGTLQFVDREHGWAVSGAPYRYGVRGGDVWSTSDGGKTWRVVKLPTGYAIASLGLAVGAPQFFGARDIVASRVILGPGNERRRIAVYTSRDGGKTWVTRLTPSSIRVRFVDLPYNRFSASSPSDWAVLIGTDLYVTNDAGRHWTKLRPNGHRLVDVDYASPSSAWLLTVAPDCANDPPNACVASVLLHTTDGGKTWHET